MSSWVNCGLSAVKTRLAYYHTSESSIVLAATGRFPGPVSNVSCLSGPTESSPIVNGSGDIWPYQVYESSPFNPPELKITTSGQSLAPGLLFITPSDGTSVEATKDTAPLIMTDTGQLVWNGPTTSANNFRVASYQGNPVLTYWSDSSASGANVGHGYGNVTFLDTTYHEILNICPKFGLSTPDDAIYPCEADFHESFVTDRNTLLVTAYNVTNTDLSSIDGPSSGWVFDCLFFELDPRNGSILFRWSALEHVPVNETKLDIAGRGGFNQSNPFDWFHINSVVNIGDHFLVNSRHLWATYLITAEGEIAWTLQGDTGGDFGALPPNGHFAWQHYARPHNITETSIIVSYFNNFNALGIDNGTRPSNGLVLQVTLPPNKSSPPTVLDYLTDPDESIYSDSQGSTTLLPNANVFMGYGEIAVMKEYGPGGPSGSDVRWTARFGLDNLVQSYRGFKAEWQGFPTTSPDLVVKEDSNGCRAGYVSWNGATNVEAWVVFDGPAEHQLSQVARIPFKGFETRFAVADRRCLQVAAVVDGEISSRSSVVCTFSNETRHG